MSLPAGIGSDDFGGLLAAARAGCADAVGRLLMQCRDYLLLVANRSLEPDLQAKMGASDLVQETFLEAQRDFGRFHGEREEELLAWLSRILVNNIANANRRYRATEMRALELEVPFLAGEEGFRLAERLSLDTPGPAERLAAVEQEAALQTALAALPENYRRVLHLRYQERLTFAQVGAALGCSAEAARKLWGRAVNRLQQGLRLPDEP